MTLFNCAGYAAPLVDRAVACAWCGRSVTEGITTAFSKALRCRPQVGESDQEPVSETSKENPK